MTFPVIVYFVAQFFASMSRGPIFAGQINLYGAYAYDLGPDTIGLLATAVTIVGIPISLSSGYIMDHFGRKATLVPGFALLTAALAFISITAYAHVPFELFVAAYLCVYASNSITGGNMQTLGSDIAPENARGRFYGVSHTLGSLGSPIATSGFALLSGAVGYWSAFAFLGMTAGGALFILAALVRDRLREKRTPAASTASA